MLQDLVVQICSCSHIHNTTHRICSWFPAADWSSAMCCCYCTSAVHLGLLDHSTQYNHQCLWQLCIIIQFAHVWGWRNYCTRLRKLVSGKLRYFNFLLYGITDQHVKNLLSVENIAAAAPHHSSLQSLHSASVLSTSWQYWYTSLSCCEPAYLAADCCSAGRRRPAPVSVDSCNETSCGLTLILISHLKHKILNSLNGM